MTFPSVFEMMNGIRLRPRALPRDAAITYPNTGIYLDWLPDISPVRRRLTHP